ncbi:MAG TPA: dienelactone hydrolase family protein [Thermoanaerobaculia bacterium]|jgi:carboxymethylenebutenolidase|nr:dienelactone hydrolase family protein [Thermoanaerobaculia bacterium]
MNAPLTPLSFALFALLAAALTPRAGAQPAATGGDDPTAAMAHEHAHDAPTPSPAVGRSGGAEKVKAETVAYGKAGDETFHGYLARPEGAKKGGPAVLLIHEWWGLNDNIRDIARQLASHGYLALAVDVYHAKSASTPDEAQGLMRGVMAHPEAAEENLRQAVHYLHAKAGAGKVGVVGWCFGGGWSLQTALLVPDGVQAVVMYYGRPELDRAKLAKLQAPLLGNFGEQDQGIKPEGVRQFEALLKELGKSADIKFYPGAGHAFANPSGGNYVKAAADDAWQRTLAFFDAHLKS